ncbi:MAG TPA: outer membrane beta-barrel protein, partial [Chthoniobacterales bacterium]|nr:outer membrane beta-barrel protein [Chthoniobacterales bacterium]
TTIRGRLGFAFGHWLFYGTGGGIGVNYEKHVIDDCSVFPCGPELIDAHETEFAWGWTGGGGIEYMLGCHWTARVEYLRFELDREDFSGTGVNFGITYKFNGDTEGNIVRAALNYKF